MARPCDGCEFVMTDARNNYKQGLQFALRTPPRGCLSTFLHVDLWKHRRGTSSASCPDAGRRHNRRLVQWNTCTQGERLLCHCSDAPGASSATINCNLLAAAISYFVLLAFIPLATFLVAILGFVMRDPQLQQNAVERVLRLLPLPAGSGDNLVLDALHNVSSQSGTLTVIGLVGLIWAGSGVFGAIRDRGDRTTQATGARPLGVCKVFPACKDFHFL